MLRLTVLLVATLGLTAGRATPPAPPAGAPPQEPAVASLAVPDAIPGGDAFATVPRAPWRQGDPADSLYKLAREHLNQGDYRQAAALFRGLADRYPKSTYAADALYWHAFALYRMGGRSELHRAQAALAEQKQRYPNANTRGDADALMARINGELAREGDADAAESIAEQASAIAEAAVANLDIGAIAAEATKAGMDAARAAMEATAAALPGGRMRGDSLPQECAAQREKNDMRVAALNALLQMDADQALPVLRDVLRRRDVCSAPLRRQAVFLISQKRTAETEDVLLDVVRNDPDPRVREQAVFFLSQVPGEKAVTALQNILATSKDTRLQERALFALSQHHSPGAAEALRKFTADESAPADLREKAIFWLGQERSPENDEFLRQLFKRSATQSQKERILFSLSQARSPANDRFLTDVAIDASQPIELRKRALFWASQSGGLTPADLGRMYDSGDRQMREQIIFVLGQRKDGIDKLLDIARNEKEPALRSKAIFWLGQSRDPRAVKVLQEIINQ